MDLGMRSEKLGNLVSLVCREIVSDDMSLGVPQVGRRVWVRMTWNFLLSGSCPNVLVTASCDDLKSIDRFALRLYTRALSIIGFPLNNGERLPADHPRKRYLACAIEETVQ
jgi:hypothetical protein